MTTPKHTPEPWKIVFDTGIDSADESLENQTVLFFKAKTDPKNTGLDGDIEQQKANVDRIVACVNACKGFTEEELETLGHYKAFHDTIIAENEQLRNELSKLKGDSNV